MLLVDSSDLSVYEVPNDILSCCEELPRPIPFKQFELNARSCIGTGLVSSTPDSQHNGMIGLEALVFVRLADGRGWAWASRMRVDHNGEFPIEEAFLGDGFLFLWPVPMSFNAYLNVKQKARRADGSNPRLVTFLEAVEAHPPSMTFEPTQLKEHAIESARKIRFKDLSIPQRIFVSSLAPHATSFRTRVPCDKWCDLLLINDRIQLTRFLQDSDAKNHEERAMTQSHPMIGARALNKRRTWTPCFDMPDDVLSRVLAFHISEHMWPVHDMAEVVAFVRGVNRQFCRVTNTVLQQMCLTVTGAARSLLGDCPREPRDVQNIVHASGLTLRGAFAMPLSGWWRLYIRRRHALEHQEHIQAVSIRQPTAEERRHLLWGLGA